ncbi:MAG: type II toxin-antitoxin system Phd/YefM family antitoxin [Alphaproteobacteria bacterium]
MTEIPDIISYTQARNNLKAVMDKVWNDSAPVVITRAGGKAVVMMSKDEYDSMTETDYLLSSPANARELRAAIKEVSEGRTIPMKFNKAGKLVRAD